MKALVLIVAVSIFAGVVGALVYGAVQVSPGTWDTAVIMLASSASANIALHGVARVVAARHAPPVDQRQITSIDKALFLENKDGQVIPWR